VTLVCSPGIRDLGAWLEQLLAESTGKEGKGLIPVDREPPGAPSQYGDDRVFVYVRLDRGADAAQERAIASLQAAGQPVIQIGIEGPYQLAAEFFRWEIATAVAGSILGINPFDQPDVESAKVATRRITSSFEESGSLPADAISSEPWEQGLRRLFDQLPKGAYVALLAFIEMHERHEAALNAIRERIRDATRAATCLGFGPRYLHSTGQAYKGGPAGGAFVEITCDDPQDIPVPGQKYTFGVVKAAQAQGDLEVLRERGRRTLRVHLGRDVGAGLAQLAAAAERALQ
jgi:transaldolase/glucose-6-phosphate isomerase